MTTSRAALIYADTLAAHLKDRLLHRRTDALKRLAEMMALHIPRTASLEPKTKVVAQVFHDLHFRSQNDLAILLPLVPNGRVTMAMDRMTWHYGKTPLNILVLGVALGGVALVKTVLPHQGNVLARREFVGKEWCGYLRWSWTHFRTTASAGPWHARFRR